MRYNISAKFLFSKIPLGNLLLVTLGNMVNLQPKGSERLCPNTQQVKSLINRQDSKNFRN
ncbi:hypothetical protein D7Y06_09615 [Roseburia sp. 1XD42-69]|nr:hypothetical protein D7Y06_09615 [Roseburia sp. 1XD42-69]